jgi:hypothetical protein
MSDGWCEKCWKRGSLKDAQGRYTYRCEVCGPEKEPPIPVIPVNDQGESLWRPSRAERRMLKAQARRAQKGKRP